LGEFFYIFQSEWCKIWLYPVITKHWVPSTFGSFYYECTHGHIRVQLHGHENDAMCCVIQVLLSVVNACEFDYFLQPFHLSVAAINWVKLQKRITLG